MELIKVQIDNIKVLQDLARTSYSANFGSHWDGEGLEIYLESQFGDIRLTEDLLDSNIDYYLIDVEGQPVGFAKVNLEASLGSYKSNNCAELEKLYLLSDFKRKGLGKEAMYIIIEDLKQKGKEVLFLCAIETNHQAIAFYKSIGFLFHSKCRLGVPYFKDEMRGMDQMMMELL